METGTKLKVMVANILASQKPIGNHLEEVHTLRGEACFVKPGIDGFPTDPVHLCATQIIFGSHIFIYVSAILCLLYLYIYTIYIIYWSTIGKGLKSLV